MQDHIIPAASAGIVACATFIWGAADAWLLGLLVFIAVDYITGVIAAYINKELSSKTGFRGILKKLLVLCVVAVAHVLDTLVGVDGVLRGLAIGFLLANEGISVLENCSRCGVPVPVRLMETLEQLRDKK